MRDIHFVFYLLINVFIVIVLVFFFFSLSSVPREEAISYFAHHGYEHCAQLVKATPKTHVDCYSCDIGGEDGRVLALAHGAFVANIGELSAEHFDVECVQEPYLHFRLHHAVPLHSEAGGEASFGFRKTAEPKLIEEYASRKAWGERLNLHSITSINHSIMNGGTKRVVQLAEAQHDSQIASIAEQIVKGRDGVQPRLVLIAGPSSSGKTTMSKRLGVMLEAMGVEPTVVSVDSYYRAWQEIDERGMQFVDWESMKSLNLPLLNDQLLALLDGREVNIPEYDMKTSMPMTEDHWIPTKLASNGLIIMEGIHCLNPALTSKVPSSDKFHIMISPLSAVKIDDHNLISSSQVRLLRRMVRDNLTRGRSAASTLKQWGAVVKGEHNNIFPNQNNADVIMNSGLAYEPNILKVFAEPLLRSITPDMDEYQEAQRLLQLLDSLVSMPAHLVPPQSLLREFIGGSWFYDYAGWYKSA